MPPALPPSLQHLATKPDEQPEVSTMYNVELTATGQPECQCVNCQLWTITYSDPEPTEIGTSWQGEAGKETAEDICDLMNMAYEFGRAT